jgi:hypothetical protein
MFAVDWFLDECSDSYDTLVANIIEVNDNYDDLNNRYNTESTAMYSRMDDIDNDIVILGDTVNDTARILENADDVQQAGIDDLQSAVEQLYLDYNDLVEEQERMDDVLTAITVNFDVFQEALKDPESAAALAVAASILMDDNSDKNKADDNGDGDGSGSDEDNNGFFADHGYVTNLRVLYVVVAVLIVSNICTAISCAKKSGGGGRRTPQKGGIGDGGGVHGYSRVAAQSSTSQAFTTEVSDATTLQI